MPGREGYGPGGKWIHDRAHHILRNNPDLREKGERGKSIAYALATQQGHRVGKSPKGFRTPQGVREAKVKYDKPRREYTKTPNPKTKTSAADVVDAWLRKVSAGPPPSIPTPQFPTGLQKIQPNKVPNSVSATGKPAVLNSQSYTQVHSQPPMVNSAPYTGVKSAPPPVAR